MKMDNCKNLHFRLNGNFIRIGRHSQNEICLITGVETTLSRWHAQIRRSHTGTYSISDISVNGTYINRCRVLGNMELNDGDVINVGCKGGHEIKPGEPMADGVVPEFNLKLYITRGGDFLEKTDADKKSVKLKIENADERFPYSSPECIIIDSEKNDGIDVIAEWEIKTDVEEECQITNNNEYNNIINNSNKVDNNNNTADNNNKVDMDSNLNKDIESNKNNRKRHSAGKGRRNSCDKINRCKSKKRRKTADIKNCKKNKNYNFVSDGSSCKENDDGDDSNDSYLLTNKFLRLKNVTDASFSKIKHVRLIQRNSKEIFLNKYDDGKCKLICPINENLNSSKLYSEGDLIPDSQEECSSRHCKRPIMSEITWVQCDDCDKWYHLFCIDCALDVEEIKKSKYSCCKL